MECRPPVAASDQSTGTGRGGQILDTILRSTPYHASSPSDSFSFFYYWLGWLWRSNNRSPSLLAPPSRTGQAGFAACINKLPSPATCSHTSIHPHLGYSPSSITHHLQPNPLPPPCSLPPVSPFLQTSPTRDPEDEEQEAVRRRRRRRVRGRRREHQQRRREQQQDGAEGRGEEPEAAHEGPLPQALRPRPRHLRPPHPPLPHLQLLPAKQHQQGRDHAAGPARQRGGVHQAAQGPDRRAEAAEAGRRRLLLLLRQQGVHHHDDERRDGGGVSAGDRGAPPGRDAGRGVGERGREAFQAARGDRGARAGGRRGGQRQLLPRRRQDLLHAPLPGALHQDRPRGRQGLPKAPRPRRSRSRCRLRGMSQ